MSLESSVKDGQKELFGNTLSLLQSLKLKETEITRLNSALQDCETREKMATELNSVLEQRLDDVK